MSLDAFIFIDHAEGMPHCEIKRTDDPDPFDEQNFAYLEARLQEIGEETVPLIGDTAVKLDGIEVESVLPDMEVLCKVHAVADPTDLHADTVTDYFVTGQSLI